MDNQRSEFSKNLVALSLQLKTLFEGFGGDETLRLLDSMGQLSGREQRAIVRAFQAVLARVIGSEERYFDENDRKRADLEENLYQDILNSLRAAGANSGERANFSVLAGGRSVPRTGRRIGSLSGRICPFPGHPRRAT